jgi:hypothetical protein
MRPGLETVLPRSKAFAKKFDVDLAIPNCKGSGLGNALVYTRLVEDWARHRGRPVSIVTAPLAPSVGVIDNDDTFAIWRCNPFIERIIDGNQVDEEGFNAVDLERRTLVQVNHIIENISFAYGLRPRRLKPSLFLERAEMNWALQALSSLPRPLVCLHPGGNSRSLDGSIWAGSAWHEVMDLVGQRARFYQVGRPEFGDVNLGLYNPARTLRETMALIWAADAFVGFDSAPMHIATAFDCPTIAVFDMAQKYIRESQYTDTHVPSVMLRWSYPHNRNIAIMPNDQTHATRDIIIDAILAELTKLTYRL